MQLTKVFHAVRVNSCCRFYLGPSGYEVGFVSEAHTYEQLDLTATAFADGLMSLNNDDI